MQTYSTIVVIDSLLKSEEIDSTIEKIERNIKNNGGEIIKIDRGGKKRLAYEIKKRQYGYYIEILFKARGVVVKVIEREYGLDENILRYLTLVLNKKALQHYQSDSKKPTKKIEKQNLESAKTEETKIEEKKDEQVEHQENSIEQKEKTESV